MSVHAIGRECGIHRPACRGRQPAGQPSSLRPSFV